LSEETLLQAAKEFFGMVPYTDKAKYCMGLIEGKRAQLDVADDDSLYLEIKNGKINVTKGKAKSPEWTLYSSKEIYLALFRSQLSLTQPIGVDKMSMNGRGASLGPIISMCQEAYRQKILDNAPEVKMSRGRDYV
jgi:putative sterol carrier protein